MGFISFFQSLDEEWAAYKVSVLNVKNVGPIHIIIFFKITHKRVFDAEEDATRKALFAANLKKVNDHNVKYKAGEVTYELGINHFSDRTEAELKQMHGVRLPLQKN